MDVFGSSGTRGVANEEITPAFVLQVVAAAGAVWEADRVAIGRDTRHTGRMLENAAVAGLQSVGCDVARLGVLPTPGVQALAVRPGAGTLDELIAGVDEGLLVFSLAGLHSGVNP
ncbi:MAG: metallopeptidase TldD-related protein, partial [Halalkalicoccus sp.]